MDKIIPIRISEALVEKLDVLIEQGIFRNRNEVIRTGIRALINHYSNKSANKKDIAKIIASYIFKQFSTQFHCIILFGSVALRKDTPESDVDLFILTKSSWSYAQKEMLYLLIIQLLKKVDIVISLHFEDLKLFQLAVKENSPFEQDIYQKGIILEGQIPLSFNSIT